MYVAIVKSEELKWCYVFYPAGPVLIHCLTRRLYLRVEDENTVRATSQKGDASKFYLKPSINPKYPDEFYICYKSSNGDESENPRQALKYLQTPLSLLGKNPGPLRVECHGRNRDIRLVLWNNIRMRHQCPASLLAWMSGSEVCYIQCARRRQKNGYVAVEQDGTCTRLCCVRSKHDSKGTLFEVVEDEDEGLR